MHVQLTRFFHRVAFVTLVLITSKLRAAPVLADRLLIEVNDQSYSQREVELYVIAKRVLMNSVVTATIFTEGWPRVLEEFLEDMLLEQESFRVGSVRPTDSMIEQASTALGEAAANKDGAVRSHWDRLSGPLAEGAKPLLERVIRVEAYKRSLAARKEKATRDRQDQEDGAGARSARDKAAVRYYKDADKYQEIILKKS